MIYGQKRASQFIGSVLKSFNCSASTGRPMRPSAASVIIWHRQSSFLSLARIACSITSAKKARKVTGLPNYKRLEKSICSVTVGSSWSSGVPVPCGHGVALEKGFARVRSTVDFGRWGGESGLRRISRSSELFTGISIKVASLSISVSLWYLGQISHSPSDCHRSWDILGQQCCTRYTYLFSPLQIEQRSLPRQWFATWP